MTETSDVAASPRPRSRQLLSILIALLVVISLAWAVNRNWSDVWATWEWLSPAYLAGSLGCLLVAIGATWLEWRAVLQAYGVEQPAAESAQVFFVSQLGKYAPGSVWPILIQARSARRHGARPVAVVIGNLIALVVSLVIGLAIAGLTLPFADPATLRRFWWTLVAVPLLVVALHPALVPWLINLWLRRRGGAPVVAPSGRTMLKASTWSAVSWMACGAHIYLLASGEQRGFAFYALCTGALSMALCAGILLIPAPAGAGVREAVLVATLSTVLTFPAALAIAVASRVLFLMADLVLAGIAVMVRRLA